jgi:hypothetical protein
VSRGANRGSWRHILGIRGFRDIAGRIAGGQHGRVTRQQLLAAGLDRSRIDRWLADGRLVRVHHAVYAVGHRAPSMYGDYMAAVLACGPGAVLSHRAAAFLLRLLRCATPPPPEVTVPTTNGRRRPGIIIHRVASLPARDWFTLDGIRVTTVPRTLLDLAPATEPEELTRMCHEAWVHHRTRPAHVDAVIARDPGKKGATKLKRAQRADATLGELESGFLALLNGHGLPRPRTNIDLAGDKVDCHWPQHGLTIELHSYRFHASRLAFERDLARRRRSSHVAYSYGDVFERPARTAAEIAALLTA